MSNSRIVVAAALLTLSAFTWIPWNAQACLNYAEGTDLKGRRFESDWYSGGEEMAKELLAPEVPERRKQWADFVVAEVRKKPDFRNLNSLGVLLVHQGQYAVAIRHFVDLEKRFPGRHETAANLGTALELAGYDDIALSWIRIGIQRNPDEHYRTEWLHVRILETKLALKRDPRYLADGHSIAGVDFARVPTPKMPAMPPGNDGKPITPALLNTSLSYQLYERIKFVKPKDPVMANLFNDWATLHLIGGSIENADALYDLAVTYGARRDTLMNQRQAWARKVLREASASGPLDGDCAICERR